MTSPTDLLAPQLGDSVYLGSFLANIHCHGIISDLDTPDMVSFSIEGVGPNGVLSTRVLVGPRGPAGAPSFILKLQQQVYNDPDDLPQNLTTETFDVGKYWNVVTLDEDFNPVSTLAYVWYGDHFESFPMGSPGPAGPVPLIAPSFELVDETVTENCFTEVLGDNYHPSWHTQINKELIRGPVGPSTNISNAPDYDNSVPAQVGDAVVWNGVDFAPTPIGTIVPKFYTMPEAAFVNVPLAIGTSVSLGAFVVPPQDWDCVPYVQGHLRIIGVEADSDPMIIGCEVRLGNATTGPVVARGYGNISTYAFLTPQASTASTPNDAITPTNGRAVIPAGSTGVAATLYISAFNDGLAGIYSFEKRGAQISIMLLPV